jgi:hypothetical protein
MLITYDLKDVTKLSTILADLARNYGPLAFLLVAPGFPLLM